MKPPTDRPDAPERDIADLIRAAEAEQRLDPPAAVWDRVRAELPASDRQRLRARRRARFAAPLRLAAAACAAGLLTLTGYLALRTGPAELTPVAVTDAFLDQGELELSAPTGPLLGSEVYEGVLIREGRAGVDELRVCVRC